MAEFVIVFIVPMLISFQKQFSCGLARNQKHSFIFSCLDFRQYFNFLFSMILGNEIVQLAASQCSNTYAIEVQNESCGSGLDGAMHIFNQINFKFSKHCHGTLSKILYFIGKKNSQKKISLICGSWRKYTSSK